MRSGFWIGRDDLATGEKTQLTTKNCHPERSEGTAPLQSEQSHAAIVFAFGAKKLSNSWDQSLYEKQVSILSILSYQIAQHKILSPILYSMTTMIRKYKMGPVHTHAL